MREFEDAFVGLHRVAFRTCFTVLGDHAESEDLAQEALARALVRWRKVEPYAEAFVCRAATNLALDRVRSAGWRRRSGHDPLRLEHGALDPDAAARLDLQRALRSLSKRQREVVVMRFLLDQSEEAVAAALGVSVGSVKTHASRGLSQLRGALGEAVTR